MKIEGVLEFRTDLILLIPIPIVAIVDKDTFGIVLTWLGGFIGFKVQKTKVKDEI